MRLKTDRAMNNYAFWLLVLFFGIFDNAMACSCQRLTFEEKIDNAQWIVIVKINKLELLEDVDENLGHIIGVGFEPIEFLKGTPSELQQMLTTTSTCGFDYEIARTYLVFADRYGQTNICTGTMPFVAEDRFPFSEDFTQFYQNVTAYINGEKGQIDAFYNPISNQTINGLPKKVESGCDKKREID
jgi:hypothetical protein